MSNNTQAVGSTDHPATASGSCCGSPARPADTTLPLTGETPTTSPCCGSTSAAQAAGSCCDASAKAAAISAGQGCCG